MSALDLQEQYLALVMTWLAGSDEADDPTHAWTIDLWSRSLESLGSGDLTSIESELDWVIKYRLLTRYLDSQGLDWDSPRIAQLDLAFHDIKPSRGVFPVLERRGLAARLVSDSDISHATTTAPQTTRARLRGDFLRVAAERGRDVTVDWAGLKINDAPHEAVVCADPFASVDERVERLIAEL
jgi:proteasome accessory factor A